MSDQPMPTNEVAAQAFAESISDDTARNLVLLGIAMARKRFVKPAGQSDSEWRRELPQYAFDMYFYATVLASMFTRQEVIRALLAGKSIENATDWEL